MIVNAATVNMKYIKKFSLNESLKKDGHRYEVEEVGETSGKDRGGVEMDKAYAGRDGILGNNGIFISWSDIKRLMKKHAR